MIIQFTNMELNTRVKIAKNSKYYYGDEMSDNPKEMEGSIIY